MLFMCYCFFISEVVLYVHLNPTSLPYCLLIQRLHRDMNWGMEVKMRTNFHQLSMKYIIEGLIVYNLSNLGLWWWIGDSLYLLDSCCWRIDEMFLYSQRKNLTATRLWIQFSTILATKFDDHYNLRLTIHFLICWLYFYMISEWEY